MDFSPLSPEFYTKFENVTPKSVRLEKGLSETLSKNKSWNSCDHGNCDFLLIKVMISHKDVEILRQFGRYLEYHDLKQLMGEWF